MIHTSKLNLMWFISACLALPLPAEQVAVSLLATTDLHGNLYPYDYLTGKPADRGLAKIATLVRAERRRNPNVLLVDCGDTIQGTPLESVYHEYATTGKLPFGLAARGLDGEPMMRAMNVLGYDAMALGNHEFNFGLKSLNAARSSAQFPWLSANTTGGAKPFLPYIVKTVAGVKVAVIGITTPAVPSWEKAENYAGYRFEDGVTAARAAVEQVRAKERPDVVVVAAHAGLGRDLKTGAVVTSALPGENMVDAIAREVSGIDAIVFGHTHQQLEQTTIGDVLLVQPKNWGISLARIDFTLERSDGGTKLMAKASKLLPATRDTVAEPEILAIARPYHEITEQFLDHKAGQASASIDASRSRIEDTAIIDAIHEVQLHYAKADVSFAASFNPRAAIARGPVTVRQLAALYLYDNELYAIAGNGKMVKDALENAARFYNTCKDAACAGPLINSAVIGFNYDMAQGVTYDIDLTRAPGGRIVNLRFRGRPLAPGRKLRIAVNNYRAAGSGGYTMFKSAPVLWRSYDEIRDLMIRYYSTRPLPVKPDRNWRVVPAQARAALQREVAGR